MRRHGVIRKGTPGPDAAPALRARAARISTATPRCLASRPCALASSLPERGPCFSRIASYCRTRGSDASASSRCRRASAGASSSARSADARSASVWTCGRFSNACAVCAACCHDPEETSACSRARDSRPAPGARRGGLAGCATVLMAVRSWRWSAVSWRRSSRYSRTTGWRYSCSAPWNTGSPASGRRASSMSAASASMNAWRTAPSGAWAEASAACSGSMARASRAMGLSGSGCATAPGAGRAVLR